MEHTLDSGGEVVHLSDALRWPDSTEERVAQLRAVVDQKQYRNYQDMVLDLFTASVILVVYDALNDKNKLNLISRPLREMAIIALRVYEKTSN